MVGIDAFVVETPDSRYSASIERLPASNFEGPLAGYSRRVRVFPKAVPSGDFVCSSCKDTQSLRV